MAEVPEYPYESEGPEGLKEEALLCVDQALLLEETNNVDQALVMYQKALEKLDLAITKYEALGEDMTRKKKCLQLNSIRQQVLFRLQEHKTISSKSSNSQLVAINDDEMPSDAEILFHIASEVQIFYISKSGQVSCPSYPTSLSIFRFKDNGSDQPAFLKVGSWVYPLVPGKSPVLKSRFGSYLFPDLDNSIEGNAIGIIFPKDLPLDELQVFEVILDQLTAIAKNQQDFDVQSYDEYKQLTSNLSTGIVQGAEFVGLGLVAASVKASELLHKGSEKLKENIQPADSDLKVDDRIKTGLQAACWTASKAAQGTGYLASKASAATYALGRFLAPHIREKGALALSHFAEQSEEKSHKQLEIAGEVLGGTVRAFSAIYLSLESSGKILVQNISNSTVNVVSHRYGSEVGTVTENALSTAGNTYLTVYNAAALGPKGLAKRAAKNTAKAVVLSTDPLNPSDTPGENQEKNLGKNE